jgi:hypothetical protein
MEPYERAIDAIRPEVSIGFATIRVFRPSETKSQQVGFSVSPNGESLTGDKDGDWLQTWVAIGYQGRH